MKHLAIAFIAAFLAIVGSLPTRAQAAATPPTAVTVTKAEFGKLADGRVVDLYTMTNRNGMIAKVMTFGAIITELRVPDRTGKAGDIILGYDNFNLYVTAGSFFGATVGRVANRIANARFTLDGKDYTLTSNLHGGRENFARRLWQGAVKQTPDGQCVIFSYTSADGEEGFPGKLDVTASYTLTDKNELRLDYTAATDKPTLVNLTNHCWFNLAGAGQGDVRKHVLTLNSTTYTVVGQALIPTGVIAPVEGTPLDFRKPREIGQDIDKVNGYDHNYVLDHKPGELGLCARIAEPTTGRVMEIWTTEPGVQFYSGNGLNGRTIGIGGAYAHYGAFCLETQHYPDSIHYPAFPSTVLRPGQTYTSQTSWRYSTN